MKKHLYLAIAAILLASLLASGALAFAAVTSEAEYLATIRVTNNSTAANDINVPFTLNSQSLIDNENINTSFNNTALVTNAGADTAYMPSVNSSYPWCVYVPSIGGSTTLDYNLYLGGATDMAGKICYFPSPTGMTCSDNASMEPSDNFTIELKGLINTSYSGTTSNTTSTLNIGLLSHSGLANWVAAQLIDENPATAGFDTDTSGVGSYMQIDFGSGNATGLTRWYYYIVGTTAGATWDIQFSDNATNWTTVFTGLDCTTSTGWKIATWSDVGSHRYWRSYKTDAAAAGGITHRELSIFTTSGSNKWLILKDEAFQVGITGSSNITASMGGAVITATGISSGEHTVSVSADTANLSISIDGILQDTVTLAGTSVPDNSNNWTFCRNNVMPYMETANLSINGLLQGSWEWEYATTFTDLSGNNHDMTPSFRTASSAANVSAELLSFQPISQAQADAFSLGTAGEIVTDAPDQPAKLYQPGSEIKLILAPAVNAILDAGNVPHTFFWYPVTFVIIIIAGFISYKIAPSLLIKAIVLGSALAFFALTNVFGFWTVMFFVMEAFAVIVLSKHYGW